MFGHHDDHTSQQDTDDNTNQSLDPEDQPSGQPAEQAEVTESSAASTEPASSDASTATPDPAAASDQTDDTPWQHPGTPLDSQQNQVGDVISPAGGFPKKPSFQPSSITSDDSADDTSSAATDSDSPLTHELIDIKQQALGELSPLVDKLDQTPEEKFRTIMMMIQASDDQTLVKAAYTAAHSIEDEKARAQALLDIVNEVNYFTQQR